MRNDLFGESCSLVVFDKYNIWSKFCLIYIRNNVRNIIEW